MIRVLAVSTMLILTACGTSSPLTVKTELINRPVPSEEQLTCLPEPLVKDAKTDTQAEYRAFLESIRLAGANCRSQLSDVKEYLERE